MKKLIYLIVAIVILGLIVSGCILSVVPPTEKDEITSLTKAKPDVKPGTDFRGPHYNLNLIGKKSDWSGGGDYNNPNRHTMFVPEYTEGFSFEVGGVTFYDSIKISMTQNSEFAVLDGNAFDDGECAFQLASGEYNVYIVAKAKPGGYTDITGWVYAEDETGTSYWFLDIGSLRVTKSKKWKDATHIFYVSDSEDPFGLVGAEDMWVFYYMSAVEAYLGDDPTIPGEPYTEYFWEYDNHGNKLVKVRFYEKPPK